MIRAYEATDWPAVEALLDGGEARSPEKKRLFGDPHFEPFLFLEGEEIAGWAVLEVSADRLLIDWIYVRERFRRRGIGSALVKRAVERGVELGLRGVSVNTGSNTYWARRLYEKNAFREVGTVKEFFSFDPAHVFYWYPLR